MEEWLEGLLDWLILEEEDDVVMGLIVGGGYFRGEKVEEEMRDGLKWLLD